MKDEEFLRLLSELADLDHGAPVSYLYWSLKDILSRPASASPPGRRPRVILFGARGTGEIILTFLRKTNLADVLCFFDVDSRRWNTQVHDIDVLQPKRSEVEACDAVIVSTLLTPEVRQALSDLKMEGPKLCDDPAEFITRFRPDFTTGLSDPRLLLKHMERPFLCEGRVEI